MRIPQAPLNPAFIPFTHPPPPFTSHYRKGGNGWNQKSEYSLVMSVELTVGWSAAPLARPPSPLYQGSLWSHAPPHNRSACPGHVGTLHYPEQRGTNTKR